MVANSINDGTMPANKATGVNSSRRAPTSPPTRLTRRTFLTLNSVMVTMSCRYAHAAVNVPGNRATALEALASIGPSPANNKAGNVTRLPPPASEFKAPPTNAARKSMVAVMKCARTAFTLQPPSSGPRSICGQDECHLFEPEPIPEDPSADHSRFRRGGGVSTQQPLLLAHSEPRRRMLQPLHSLPSIGDGDSGR